MRDGFESYKAELDGLRLTEESKRALTESLCRREPAGCPARRTAGDWRRLAMAAAVLAVVLAGTALAAEFGSRVQVEDADRTWEQYTVVYNEIGRVPVKDLSKDFLEYVASMEDDRGTAVFDSWEELEAFWGMDLANNAVLDQAEKGTCGAGWGDDIKEGFCVAAIQRNDDALPTVIDIHAAYTVGEDGACQIHVYNQRLMDTTDLVPDGIQKGTYLDPAAGDKGAEFEWMTYVAHSGLEAQILIQRSSNYYGEDGRPALSCRAFFSMNYSWFEVTTRQGPDPLGQLEAILDAFE